MAKMGRPRKEVDWEEIEKLCALQCTEEEIASWFNMSIDTLRIRTHEMHGVSFQEYFKTHCGTGKVSLRRHQYQKAMEGNPAMLIWLGKQWLKQADKIEHTGADGQALIQLSYKLDEDKPKE